MSYVMIACPAATSGRRFPDSVVREPLLYAALILSVGRHGINAESGNDTQQANIRISRTVTPRTINTQPRARG